MKSLILALSMAVAAAGLAPVTADAKRIGGGSSSGMKRDMPARSAPDAVPAKPAQAAPNAAPGAAPAAAPKRSWMGPLAGLAAGLGLAALMSHLGMGEGFANIIMMVLLAGVAFFAVRFLLRRFGPAAQRGVTAPQGMQFAGAGAGASAGGLLPAASGLPSGSSAGWGPGAVAPGQSAADSFAAAAPRAFSLPADFDAAAFERIAKMIFIRMQAANDSGDLNDLRAFTTPEMFASIKLDLQERGAGAQTTDVVKLEAQVVDFVAEADRQIVSVRFHGLIQEAEDAPAGPVDEVWHLVKPADGSREWAIAGIQQSA